MIKDVEAVKSGTEGLVHLYCGDGKGKTTAAVGLAVRAAGAGKQVIFAQFMKGNESSELAVLRKIPGITVKKTTKCFGFFKNMTEEEKEQMKKMQNEILDFCLKQVQDGRCDMLILDEITHAYRYGMVDKELLCNLFDCHEKTEVVLTGRNPDAFLRGQADYITEMKKEKHPYDEGIPARPGIER